MAKAKKPATKKTAKKKPAAKKKVVKAKRLINPKKYRPCTPRDVCDWINQMAPRDEPSPWPWPLPGDHRPWLTQFYFKYVELYKAVLGLERQVYCNMPQTPVIATSCLPTGGPDKTGSPPPPQFPPL